MQNEQIPPAFVEEISRPGEVMLKFYLWLMGWSGKLNAWAWRKQAAIVRDKNRKDEEDYLKELKKKL